MQLFAPPMEKLGVPHNFDTLRSAREKGNTLASVGKRVHLTLSARHQVDMIPKSLAHRKNEIANRLTALEDERRQVFQDERLDLQEWRGRFEEIEVETRELRRELQELCAGEEQAS